MKTPRILIAAPLMPEFDRESGSRRIYDFVVLMREAGWAVTFLAHDNPGGERYVKHLQQRGVATYVGMGPRTQMMLAEGQFDVALLAFWYMAEVVGPVLRKLSPATKIIVDSIDLHFVRVSRGTFVQGEKGALLDNRFATEMVREMNAYAAADAVLTVSNKEAEIINDLVCDPELSHRVPDGEDLEASPVPLSQRRGILFLGNFRHTPNVGAAEYLCRKIVPLIDPELLAAHPAYIVGNGLNDTIRAFGQGNEHIRMVGWVPSVIPYLQQARVSAIPLLYGAGTKRKMIQPLMIGTPNVSTSIGVEGLGLVDGQTVLEANDPLTFAGHIERLLTDAELWRKIAGNGRKYILGLHGRGAIRAVLLEVIGKVRARQVVAH